MKLKNISKKVVALLVIVIVICMPIINLAHSGRTDSSGGHKDNKNKSGLGSYHYHCGGHPAHLHTGGVCPYSAPASATTTSTTTSTRTTSISSSTKQATPAKVNATSVSISEKDFEILIGESKKLSVTISPSNTTDKTITWKSDNKDVVMIDSEGELVAMGVGEATITATTSNGKESTVKVTVNPIKVSEIKLSETNLNLKIEDKVTITTEVLPENATDKTVEWASENPDIVSVEDGVIKAIASGTAKIICKSKDGVQTEVNIVIEEEEIIEEENTVETVAETIENDNNNKSSKSETVETTVESTIFGMWGGCIALASMIGLPIYGFKSINKEEKFNIKKFLGNIISYGFSIITLFFSCAATSMSELIISVATGLSIAPPICKLINQKLDGKYTVKIRIIVYVIGFALMIGMS